MVRFQLHGSVDGGPSAPPVLSRGALDRLGPGVVKQTPRSVSLGSWDLLLARRACFRLLVLAALASRTLASLASDDGDPPSSILWRHHSPTFYRLLSPPAGLFRSPAPVGSCSSCLLGSGLAYEHLGLNGRSRSHQGREVNGVDSSDPSSSSVIVRPSHDVANFSIAFCSSSRERLSGKPRLSQLSPVVTGVRVEGSYGSFPWRVGLIN
jgi:hypothetical protein